VLCLWRITLRPSCAVAQTGLSNAATTSSAKSDGSPELAAHSISWSA
jgi:hypothetical protein